MGAIVHVEIRTLTNQNTALKAELQAERERHLVTKKTCDAHAAEAATLRRRLVSSNLVTQIHELRAQIARLEETASRRPAEIPAAATCACNHCHEVKACEPARFHFGVYSYEVMICSLACLDAWARGVARAFREAQEFLKGSAFEGKAEEG